MMSSKEKKSIHDSQDFIRGRFVPTVLYVREDKDLHTRICVYNYFADLFPQAAVGAVVYMWFFNQDGMLVAEESVPTGLGKQVQFDVSSLAHSFEGTVGVSLVPNELPSLDHDRLLGTGYYTYYYDEHGHQDTSHEWEAMRFQPVESEPWICLVRPRAFPDTELIVMNAYYGLDVSEGSAEWVSRLRNAHGDVLAEKHMPALPPRGSSRTPIRSIFPDIEKIAVGESVLSIEAQGRNIMGPFTYVRMPSGDFNIHHFC